MAKKLEQIGDIEVFSSESDDKSFKTPRYVPHPLSPDLPLWPTKRTRSEKYSPPRSEVEEHNPPEVLPPTKVHPPEVPPLKCPPSEVPLPVKIHTPALKHSAPNVSENWKNVPGPSWRDAILNKKSTSVNQEQITPLGNLRPSHSLCHALTKQVESESEISADEEPLEYFSDSGEEYDADVNESDTSDREDFPAYLLHKNQPKNIFDDIVTDFPDLPPLIQVHSDSEIPPAPPSKRRKNSFRNQSPEEEAPLEETGVPKPREGRVPRPQAEPQPQQEGGPPRREIPAGPPWVRVYPPEPETGISSEFAVGNPGPTCQKFDAPIAYFFLFFTETMWQLIVTETNKYALSKVHSMRTSGLLSPHSRFRSWASVTVEEMKKYFAILLAMSLTRRKRLKDYWRNDPILHIPFYTRTMSLKRFQLVTAMLHLSSRTCPPKDQPGYDPWVKMREVLDMLNDSFKKYFIPKQNVCIHESMIGIKNRTTFTQYMANKRHLRFGVKKFELCDSATGYILQSVLYSEKYFLTGATDPFTQKVVAFLLGRADLLNKGYHLFTDNLYTKINLARWLICHKTYLTGTINKRSKELSKLVLDAGLEVGQSVYFRRRLEHEGSVLLVKYKERETRKPVHMISTAIHAQDEAVPSVHANILVKPRVILEYNKHMGGVDCKDKSGYPVSCTRMSSKLWRKIFYNFVDMSVLNAYLLYKAQHENPMSRFKFMLSIIRELASPSLPAPAPAPLLSPGGDNPDNANIVKIEDNFITHEIVPLPNGKSRVCVVCAKHHLVKRGTSYCTVCQSGVHLLCKPQMKDIPCGQKVRKGPKTK